MLNRLTPSSLKPCGNGDESFAETGEFTGQSIAEPLASWVGTSGIPVVLINKAYIYIYSIEFCTRHDIKLPTGIDPKCRESQSVHLILLGEPSLNAAIEAEATIHSPKYKRTMKDYREVDPKSINWIAGL